MRRLAEKCKATGGSHGQHRALAACKLEEIYDLLDIPNFHMTPTQLQQFQNSVEKLLMHYGWCAKHSFKNGLLRYSIVQKAHKLAHLPEMAKDVSPRCTQCYGAENFMGLMVGIAKRSIAGAAPHKAASTITTKVQNVHAPAAARAHGFRLKRREFLQKKRFATLPKAKW